MPRTPFVPPQLPPEIDFSSLVKEMSQANRALGQLNGMLVNIPNPSLLTSPLLNKEAVLSSRIEGTQATLEEVLEYEAEEKVSEHTEKERDIREIVNYRRAMNTAMEELKKRPIGETLIRQIHFILLDSVRGASKDRGNLRRIQVYIAPPGTPIEEATYVPPPNTELPSLLTNWERYINSEEEPDPLVQIGVGHYQFEAIHPFMDGNGRIGRLLVPLFLYQRNLLSYPSFYISEYFEERREEYYSFLNGVSDRGDWESWLRFFLSAMAVQALKTQTTVLRILTLYQELKDRIATISAYAVRLLDIVFETPIVSFPGIKKRLAAKSDQTIYNLLAKFVSAGILTETSGRKRNRIFVFRDLLDLLK